MIDAPSPQDLAALRSARPDRVVASPGPFTLYIGFDVRQPPFDDKRVRQALNYAIDRDQIVDLLGGSASQRSTCQILPPNFQGYAAFCPYTLEPGSGAWSAPDPDRALRLIDEAGAEGERITVSVAEVQPGAVEVMRYVVGVLKDLGLRPQLTVVHNIDKYFAGIMPPVGSFPGTPAGTPRHPHVFMSGWVADYPGAGNFIEPQFGCGARGFANPSGWCSESLDAQVDEALLLYTTDPGAANRTWTEVEHQLVEQAAQAPVTNPVTTHAVSARVENVQLHPQWGLLLSHLWVQ